MEATFETLDNGKVIISYVYNDVPTFRMLWDQDATDFLAMSDEDKQSYYDTKLKG